LKKILIEDNIIQKWNYNSDNDQVVIKVLVRDEHEKELLQILEKRGKL